MFDVEFWVGLGLGAMLGIGGNLLAADIQKQREKRKEKIDRERRRKVSDIVSELACKDLWSIGHMRTKIRVLEMVPDGYDPSLFLMKMNENEYVHRDVREVRKRLSESDVIGKYRDSAISYYDERVSYWDELKNNPVPGSAIVYDNNDLVCLVNWAAGRGVSGRNADEVAAPKFTATSASYVAHRAIVDVFGSLPIDIAEKISQRPWETVHPFGLNTAVSIAIISDDHRIVFGRRRNLAVDGYKIVCGIGEGIRADDLRSPTLMLPGPWQASVRGLKEEFSLSLPEDGKRRVFINSFCRNQKYFEYYFTGYIDLRGAGDKYSVGSMREAHARGHSQDKYETTEILDCDLTPEGIAEFLWKNSSEMTEYGKIVPCLALSSIFPGLIGKLESEINTRFANS
jgi:hypothetical protein